MTTLLRIEWLKIKNYPAFWWVTGITALTYPAVGFLVLRIYENLSKRLPPPTVAFFGSPFSFGEIWHTIGYFSSFFLIIPAILVIMLITNEYSFKTNRQNVIDGWGRKQFLTSKLLDVGIVSILVTLLYIVASVVISMNNPGSGEKAGESHTYFILCFWLQTFSQLSIAFLIGFLLRKSFFALAVFIFLFLILEPALVAWLSYKHLGIAHFLPFEISDGLIPPPAFWGRIDAATYQSAMNNIGQHVVYTLVFTLGLWLLCYRINSKKDL